MKNKKISLYLVFVIIIFGLVLYFSLKDNYHDIMKILSNANIFYLFLAILFLFLSKYLISETMYLLAKKENKNVKRFKMLQICLIYYFFAGITPSSVGGESFEVFYLKQTGIPYGKAANISIQKFLLYELSLLIANTLAVILNLIFHFVPFNSFIFICIVLAFIVNIVGLLLLYLLGYNKKFNHFIMKKGLSFLGKIRIIKNVEKTREKLDRYLDNFDEGVDKLRTDKKLFIRLIIINVASQLLLFLTAWPVALSMGITSISIIKIFVLVAYIKMLGLLVATPGNSGAIEYGFIYVFTGLLKEADIMAYMLMWRFVTHYIPLITGGLLAITWRKKGVTNEETISP